MQLGLPSGREFDKRKEKMGCDQRLVMILPLVALALSLFVASADAAVSLPQPVKLEWHYYKVHNTCDDAEAYIRHQVELFYKHDKTIAPKLLRLLYSDCFVTVCYLLSFCFLNLSFFSSDLYLSFCFNSREFCFRN